MITTPTGTTGRWFRPIDTDLEPAARVFLIPCAGGNVSMYRDWFDLFPPDIAVQAVQFPGRLDRYTEPAHTRMAPLVEELTAALVDELDGRPYALFGHSMGGLVAYRVALALERESVGGPALIGSAAWAPEGFAAPSLDKVNLPDGDLIEWVVSLGSFPEELYRDPEMLALTMPPTRADLTAYVYHEDDHARMNCAVATYSGKADPLMAAESMRSWVPRAREYLGNLVFGGGHFFIYDSAQAIAADLTRHLRRAVADAHR